MDIKNRKIIVSFMVLILVVSLFSGFKSNKGVVEQELVIDEVSIESEVVEINEDESTLEENTVLSDEVMARPLGEESDIEIDEDELKALEIVDSTPLDMETARIIVEYSNEFDINTSLILAIIDLESNFEQYEVGGAKDRGYMQIIPGTEKWLANEYGHKIGIEYNPERIFEPEYNIGLGVLYIDLLQNAYGTNYNRILSEYNRGPYSLKKYYEKNKTYVTKYSKVVLNREKKYLALND